MVRFHCENCSCSLKASESKIGKRFPCPQCGVEVAVPAFDADVPNTETFKTESAQTTEEPAAAEDEILSWISDSNGGSNVRRIADSENVKSCPYCMETIHADAVKCKFCGEFLTPQHRSAAKPPVITKPSKDPGVAAVLSVIAPGLGQVYNGRILFGFIASGLCGVLYVFGVIQQQPPLSALGGIFHFYLVVSAYNESK